MRNGRERTCWSLILYVHLITPVCQKQASQTQSAGECGKFLDIQSGHPLWNEVQGTTNRQKKSSPWIQKEQEWGAGAWSSTIFLLLCCLHRHHDLIQRFPFQVRHHGLFAGVPHGEQHQQLFIRGAVQEHPQTGATVKRSGSDRHQSCILKQERERTCFKVSRQSHGSASSLGTFSSLLGLLVPSFPWSWVAKTLPARARSILNLTCSLLNLPRHHYLLTKPGSLSKEK